MYKIPREREVSLCPCKSKASYADCCMPLHYGTKKADTAEQLMRSRYSAYFFRLTDYLIASTHPSKREPGLKAELDQMMFDVNWRFLKILNVSKGSKDDKVGKVEFVADYFWNEESFKLHECSRFKRFKGVWKYLDGKG
ncbi:MAG: SEC-C motif-containing protein [Verrucomicrobiales bacterium]|jgi:SEC-C motif-containing protein